MRERRLRSLQPATGAALVSLVSLSSGTSSAAFSRWGVGVFWPEERWLAAITTPAVTATTNPMRTRRCTKENLLMTEPTVPSPAPFSPEAAQHLSTPPWIATFVLAKWGWAGGVSGTRLCAVRQLERAIPPALGESVADASFKELGGVMQSLAGELVKGTFPAANLHRIASRKHGDILASRPPAGQRAGKSARPDGACPSRLKRTPRLVSKLAAHRGKQADRLAQHKCTDKVSAWGRAAVRIAPAPGLRYNRLPACRAQAAAWMTFGGWHRA